MATDNKEKETIYHYSRSERLKSASKLVQELNNSAIPPKSSLFKTLTATKSSAFLLLAIIMLSATAFVIRLLPTDASYVHIAGFTLNAKAFTWDNDTFVSIRAVSSNNTSETTKELQIDFFDQDDVSLHTTNVLCSNDTNQLFNYKLPEAAPKTLKLIFTTQEKETALLQILVSVE